MHHFQAVRSVIYSYISALEEDLREVIAEDLFDNLQTIDLLSESRLQELTLEGVLLDDKYELLYCLHFHEPWHILASNSKMVDRRLAKVINENIKNLPKYISLRNQVMHARPLDTELITEFYSFVDQVKNTDEPLFKNLKKTIRNLILNPATAVEVEINYDKSEDLISNNLPVPDFDETGLIGRETELEELNKLINGPWPIITMVGEGAIGKTALALRLAYKILDDPNCEFETIVWVSAKTNQLMPMEIKDLNNEIKNSLDVLDNVSSALGAKNVSEQGFDELLEYLNTFKILLIIDNLETVIDQNIRNFLSNFNSRDSKILITSRVGLGDFERRYPIDNLNSHDAVTLLRNLSKSRKVQHLIKCSNNILVKYCNRMLNSPGFIKWYVSMVQLGMSPEEALSNPKIFLNFALENVFNLLSEEAKYTIQCLADSGGDKSMSEIVYLTDFDGDKLRAIILELCAANILSLSTKHLEGEILSSYSVSNLARFYIKNKLKLKSEVLNDLRRKKAEISLEKNIVSSHMAGRSIDKYLKETISYRSEEDAICGKLLKTAFSLSRTQNFTAALEKVEAAKQLSPNFHEVYRVAGTILYYMGNYSSAEEEYETALSLKSNDPVLLFWYAGFNLRALNQPNKAIDLLNRATEIDPDSIRVKIELSRAHTFVRNFDDALDLLKTFVYRNGISVKYAKISADGLVQVYLRQLNVLLDNHLGSDALELVKNCLPDIQALPRRSLDYKVCMRISELAVKSQAIQNLIFQKEKQDTLFNIISELQNKLGSVEDKENLSADAQNFYKVNDQEIKKIDGMSIGICKLVNYRKGFGFLYCQELQKDFYFKQQKGQLIRPGQILSFKVKDGNINERERASIGGIQQNPNKNDQISAWLTSIIEGKLEFTLEDGDIVNSGTNEFEIFGIQASDMIGQEVKISIFQLPQNDQYIVFNLQVSEEQFDKYSIIKKLDKFEKFSGTISKSDEGSFEVFVNEIEQSLEFFKTNKIMRSPFSTTSLNVGIKVEFNLIFETGSYQLKDLFVPKIGYPDITKGIFKGYVKKLQKGSTYTFLVIDDCWEVILRKQDLVNEEQWSELDTGTIICCSLLQDDIDKFRAIRAKLG